MRISDWSSDVCSSDLVQRQPLGFADFADAGDHVIFRITNVVLVFPTYSPLWQGPEYIFTIGGHMNTYSEAAARVQYAEQCIEDAEDRKSVVSGKSVSVRVDLGGRRNIKKQRKQLNLKND